MPSRRRGRLGVALLSALGLLLAAEGCGQAAPPAPAALPWAQAVLGFRPDPPVARQWATMEVHLSGPDGARLAGARVRVDFLMPGMPMPPQSATLHPAGRGVYAARVLLVIGGAWVAQLRVAAPHHRTGRIDLPFEVRG